MMRSTRGASSALLIAVGFGTAGAQTPKVESDCEAPHESVPTVATVEVSKDGREQAVVLRSDPELQRAILMRLDGSRIELERARLDTLAPGQALPCTELPSMALLAGLADEDQWVRDHCQELLALQGEAAVDALAAGLVSRELDTVIRCLRVLESSTPKALLPTISRMLQSHGDERARKEALDAYAAYEPADLLDVCKERLIHDLSGYVRCRAVGILGASGDVAVLPALMEQIDRIEPREVNLAVFQALRRLTDQRFGRDGDAWRVWWHNHGAEFLRRHLDQRTRDEF